MRDNTTKNILIKELNILKKSLLYFSYDDVKQLLKDKKI